MERVVQYSPSDVIHRYEAVHGCLYAMVEEITDSDCDEGGLCGIFHKYLTYLNDTVLDYECDSAIIPWFDVCQKAARFPDAISYFLYVLVTASIVSDSSIHELIDGDLLAFVFQLIDNSTDIGIVDAVFSLLIDSIRVESPIVPIIIENVFSHPRIQGGEIVQVYEFIETVLRSDYMALKDEEENHVFDILYNTFLHHAINIGDAPIILATLRRLNVEILDLERINHICEIMDGIYKQCGIIFEPGYDSLFEKYMKTCIFLINETCSSVPVYDILYQIIPWNSIAERLIHQEDLCASALIALGRLAEMDLNKVTKYITSYIGTIEQLFLLLYDRMFSAATQERPKLLHLIYLLLHRSGRSYAINADEYEPLTELLVDLCVTVPEALTIARETLTILCPDMLDEFDALVSTGGIEA